jgi:hypothetical protein
LVSQVVARYTARVTLVAIVIVVALVAVAAEVLRLRRRVAQLEKGRKVVERHLQHLAWRLDGEPQPDASDTHFVPTVPKRDEP